MKKVVMKVIDTLTLDDFLWAFQKVLERYNKGIAAGGDYCGGDYSFMCVLSIKMPIRKKSGTYLIILVYFLTDHYISMHSPSLPAMIKMLYIGSFLNVIMV